MTNLIDDLRAIEGKCTAIHKECTAKAVKSAWDSLEDACDMAAKSFCGSWIGYHSLVYYSGLQPIPAGAYFDAQWGLQGRYSNGTQGEWEPVSFDGAYEVLKRAAKKPTLDHLFELSQSTRDRISDLREELLSIIEACKALGSDEYWEKLSKDAHSARTFPASDFVAQYCPKNLRIVMYDSVAASEGLKTPPHIHLYSQILSIRSSFTSAEKLAKVARQAALHMANKAKVDAMVKKKPVGAAKVFFGHGRSADWRELKDYVHDKLGLDWIEFNRVTPAGKTTVAKLEEMLSEASFALLVMTAEDELKDGKANPRMNVVHEAGLFQGHLGFTKAIVVLENGCEEFSNIHGLGEIRFDKGKIKGAFAEVHDVLQREGMI